MKDTSFFTDFYVYAVYFLGYGDSQLVSLWATDELASKEEKRLNKENLGEGEYVVRKWKVRT